MDSNELEVILFLHIHTPPHIGRGDRSGSKGFVVKWGHEYVLLYVFFLITYLSF